MLLTIPYHTMIHPTIAYHTKLRRSFRPLLLAVRASLHGVFVPGLKPCPFVGPSSRQHGYVPWFSLEILGCSDPAQASAMGYGMCLCVELWQPLGRRLLEPDRYPRNPGSCRETLGMSWAAPRTPSNGVRLGVFRMYLSWHNRAVDELAKCKNSIFDICRLSLGAQSTAYT